MLETNLLKIKKLCQKREDENWKFRTYLKTCSLGPEEIDDIVHRIYREVSAQIDCTTCANCCKEANFLVMEKDVQRLAEGLNLPGSEFKEKYVSTCEIIGEGGYTFNRRPCPFLVDDRCSVYGFRPGNCRSFPYLHKKDFVFKVINTIENCAICPIVFNVFERLKGEIRSNLPLDQ